MKIPHTFVTLLATCLLAGDILGEQKVSIKREQKRNTRITRQLSREEMLQNIIKWLQDVYNDQQKSRRSRSFSEEFETPFTPYSLFASNRKDDASRQNNLREYLPPSYTQKPRPFEPRPSGGGTDEEGNFVDGGYPPAGITPQPPFPIYTNPITGGITGEGYPSPTGPAEGPSSPAPEAYPTSGPVVSSTTSYPTQPPSATGYPSSFPTQPSSGYPTDRPVYPPFPPVSTERQEFTGYPTQPPVETERPLGPTEGPYLPPQVTTGYPTGRPEGPPVTSEQPGFPTQPPPGVTPEQPGYPTPSPEYPGFPTAPPPSYTPGYSTATPPEVTPGYPTAPPSGVTPGFSTAPPPGLSTGYPTAPPPGLSTGYPTAPPQTVTPGFPTRPPTGYPGSSGELSTSGPGISTQQPEVGTSGKPEEPTERPSEGGSEGVPTDEDLKHPPHIHAIDVACAKDMMTINIEFNRVFNGLIYSKGYYSMPECRYVKENSGQTKYTFTVNLNMCGTEFINAFDSQGKSYLENVLVIQNELGIQEIWDTVRSVRCLWEGNLKDHLSVGLMVGMLTQEIVTFSGDTATARLDILLGRGPQGQPASGLVKIGEPMTLVVSISGDPGFDIQVKDCKAVDSTGENVVPLTDDNGCVLKPKLFGAFQKTRNTGNSGASIIAYAYFNAFKFPDVMDIMMECNIELCKTDCEMCPSPDQPLEPGRRRKRDLPANDTLGGTLGDGVMMGKHLRVVLPEDLRLGGPSAADDGVCMSTQSFVFSASVLISLLTASSLFSAYVWLKGQSRGQVYKK
ncbi:unnamed protein product [Phaedon cochleariae]|uniref:ZP domain-containing protein n=1 Tax=Phaedon cochleariae TaxID=80249 RepID=A0A9P0GK83_PHACE|nr:unnamed protein product [Phaedon cochleariae]